MTDPHPHNSDGDGVITKSDHGQERFVVQQLDQIGCSKAALETERALPSSPAPPLIPRRVMELVFHQLRHEMEEREKGVNNPGSLMMKSFIGLPTESSAEPLTALSRIRIKEITQKTHKGRYLLGRVMTPASRTVAIQFAVEDPEGDTIQVSVYHFPTALEVNSKFLDAVFPIGTVIALREPTFKILPSGGRPWIQVDSPSDLVFVHEGDTVMDGISWESGCLLPGSPPKLYTFEEWKTRANTQFKSGHFLAAAMSYTEGISAYPSKYVLLLNRSMAYLRLDFFARAWEDCDSVLKIETIPKEDRVKALYRAGRAKYGLEEYAAAKTYFTEVLFLEEAKTENQTWVFKCEERMREQKHGEYDIVAMYKLAQTPGARVDVADFVGNVKVTTMTSRGGGRGVVATKDIQVGELLVVAKPFASVFKEDLPGSRECMTVFNSITKALDGKCKAHLVTKIATMIFGDPARANLIYDLYLGPGHPQPPPSYPPAITRHSSQYSGHLFHDGISINIQCIEAASTCNGFAPNSLSALLSPNRWDKQESPGAIYTLPSLFNHSCVPNCSISYFGDVIVIRSLRNISGGEEFTICYASQGSSYIERGKRLDRWFESCNCALCNADRSSGEAACVLRETVMSQIDDFRKVSEVGMVAPRSSVQETRAQLGQVMTTYDDSGPPRLPRMALFDAHLWVICELQAERPSLELLPEYFKALKSLGIKITDETMSGPLPAKKRGMKLPIETDQAPLVPKRDAAVSTCIGLAANFRMPFGDEIRAERWLKVARWLENVNHGGGVELFNLRYKGVLKNYVMLEFNHRVKA